MGDKRTDPGHYYPGGRVKAKSGTAPQELIVQWSDVQGKPQIAPLPDRYKDDDVKEKVNEIASKFATALAVALVGLTAFAGLVVQKAPKDRVWNDEEIVTNAYLTGENASGSGSVRMLPKYLWIADFDDSYPEDAAWYYRQPQDYGHCSSVRDGNTYSRNLDWKFDGMAEVIIRMSAGDGRLASLGVANVGTNLTEEILASGAPTRYVKALPGHTVDGINERGVVCNVNVVDGPITGWNGGDIHPLGAVRWVLDHATSALDAATNLAARIAFPQGWAQNFHWMVADAEQTWIVENGTASNVVGRAVMTNFRLIPKTYGAGWERYMLLDDAFANITNAWYTRAYARDTEWVSEFKDINEMEAAKSAWETHTKEQLRGKGLWQTVHTSIYDISNRVLRVAVQETDDWYTFQVPSAGGVKPDAVREIVQPMIFPVAMEATNAMVNASWALDRLRNIERNVLPPIESKASSALGVAQEAKTYAANAQLIALEADALANMARENATNALEIAANAAPQTNTYTKAETDARIVELSPAVPEKWATSNLTNANGVALVELKDVASGEHGGEMWTQSNMNDGLWGRVAHKDNVFVVAPRAEKGVLKHTGIWYSINGVNWSRSDIPFAVDNVYCNGDVFLAPRTVGGIMYSPDGLNWMMSDADGSYKTFDYNGEVFVAVGEGIAYSTDGAHWIKSDIEETTPIGVCIGHNDSVFVAGSRYDGLWYSTNGQNWAWSDKTDCSWNFIDHNGSVFVAGSVGDGLNIGSLWYSTDGAHWLQSDKTDGNWLCVDHVGSVFVAGSSGDGLWYSTNGTHWVQSNKTDGEWNGLDYNGSVIVAGSNGEGLWYSDDTRISTVPIVQGVRVNGVAVAPDTNNVIELTISGVETNAVREIVQPMISATNSVFTSAVLAVVGERGEVDPIYIRTTPNRVTISLHGVPAGFEVFPCTVHRTDNVYEQTVINGGEIYWDWGDGTVVITNEIVAVTNVPYQAPRVVPHRYAKAGDYTITVIGDIRKFVGIDARIPLAQSADLAYGSDFSATEVGENYLGSFIHSEMDFNRLPPRCTVIPAEMFYMRSEKTGTLELPENTVRIGDMAFDGTSYDEIVFNNKLKDIGMQAFRSTLVASVVLPSGVRTVGDNAFSQCTNLATVVLNEGLRSLGSGVFNSCSKLEHVVLPNSVTNIAGNMFRNSSVTNVDVYETTSISQLPKEAFSYWKGMGHYVLPDRWTTIPEKCFYYNTSITNITLHAGVTSIGANAFQSASKMKTMTCYATTPPAVVSSSIPTSLRGGTLYVPESATNAYANATYWKNIKNILPIE